MNILINCVGRRNYLVDYFRDALGGTGKVFTSNSYREASGMCVSDRAFVVPPIVHPEYIDTMLSLCVENEVDLLLTLYDLDVVALAGAREAFTAKGTYVLAPPLEVAEMALDKWQTQLIAERIGMRSPMTYRTLEDAMAAIENNAIHFPVIIKPRFGMASIGIEMVYDMKELKLIAALLALRTNPDYRAKISINNSTEFLYQEYLGGEEFGIDVLNDLSGQYVNSYVKKKISRSQGETNSIITVRDAEIERECEKLAASLAFEGVIDVDIIRHEDALYLLEINPRFGGMYPFTHVAGVNIPAAIIAWMKHEQPKPEWLEMRTGVISVKGFQLFVCENAD